MNRDSCGVQRSKLQQYAHEHIQISTLFHFMIILRKPTLAYQLFMISKYVHRISFIQIFILNWPRSKGAKRFLNHMKKHIWGQ